MEIVIWIVLILVFAVVGVAVGYGYRKSIVEKKINRSEETARRLYDDAVRKADDYKKEKVLEAKEEILKAWADYSGKPQELELPHAPEQFITYFEEDNRPQAALDRDIYGGMGVTVGRLRPDTLFDYKFVGLSHNTLRGAAGGAVLIAELLYRLGYFD